MARIRSIHPDACKSKKLAQASAEAERCYWRLATHCDDEGRCEDEPRLIWAACFPLSDCSIDEVDGWLWELAEVGLIRRYEKDDLRWVQVIRWSDYQHPQKKKDSPLPAPSDDLRVRVRDDDRSRIDADHETPGQEPVPVSVRDEQRIDPVQVEHGGEGSGVGVETGEGGESEGNQAGAAPPPPPSIHNGQHPNCRACGTNPRGNVRSLSDKRRGGVVMNPPMIGDPLKWAETDAKLDALEAEPRDIQAAHAGATRGRAALEAAAARKRANADA